MVVAPFPYNKHQDICEPNTFVTGPQITVYFNYMGIDNHILQLLSWTIELNGLTAEDNMLEQVWQIYCSSSWVRPYLRTHGLWMWIESFNWKIVYSFTLTSMPTWFFFSYLDKISYNYGYNCKFSVSAFRKLNVKF